MDKELIYKEFLRFLKEMKIYNDYCSNRNQDYINSNTDFFKTNYGGWKHYTEEELKEIPLHLIFRGFVWRETSQGHMFWQNINKIWKNHLYKKMKDNDNTIGSKESFYIFDD